MQFLDLTILIDHAEMMDRMGLDQDSVMIIHMGVSALIEGESILSIRF